MDCVSSPNDLSISRVFSAAFSRLFVSVGVCRILLMAVSTSLAAAASAYSPGVSASRQNPCVL